MVDLHRGVEGHVFDFDLVVDRDGVVRHFDFVSCRSEDKKLWNTTGQEVGSDKFDSVAEKIKIGGTVM